MIQDTAILPDWLHRVEVKGNETSRGDVDLTKQLSNTLDFVSIPFPHPGFG